MDNISYIIKYKDANFYFINHDTINKWVDNISEALLFSKEEVESFMIGEHRDDYEVLTVKITIV